MGRAEHSPVLNIRGIIFAGPPVERRSLSRGGSALGLPRVVLKRTVSPLSMALVVFAVSHLGSTETAARSEMITSSHVNDAFL